MQYFLINCYIYTVMRLILINKHSTLSKYCLNRQWNAHPSVIILSYRPENAIWTLVAANDAIEPAAPSLTSRCPRIILPYRHVLSWTGSSALNWAQPSPLHPRRWPPEYVSFVDKGGRFFNYRVTIWCKSSVAFKAYVQGITFHNAKNTAGVVLFVFEHMNSVVGFLCSLSPAPKMYYHSISILHVFGSLADILIYWVESTQHKWMYSSLFRYLYADLWMGFYAPRVRDFYREFRLLYPQYQHLIISAISSKWYFHFRFVIFKI